MLQHGSAIATLGATLLASFAMAGCQSSASDAGTGMAGGDTPACSVHLWDGGHFKDGDIVVKGPGKFADLSNLPNANGKDWSDEADSLKVGSSATVKAWTKKNFKGTVNTYKPGTEKADLDDEPSSLKITCK
jgi:hypothetical protein